MLTKMVSTKKAEVSMCACLIASPSSVLATDLRTVKAEASSQFPINSPSKRGTDQRFVHHAHTMHKQPQFAFELEKLKPFLTGYGHAPESGQKQSRDCLHCQ